VIREKEIASTAFYTSEWVAHEPAHTTESARGKLLIASCRSGSHLASRVVQRYRQLLADAGATDEVTHLEDVDFQFSDSETCVRLDSDVNGYDVHLFQSLYDPTAERSVDQNMMAFLIAARAFREWGANHICAILPYLAYARQDKPTRYKREPTTAKLMADLAISAGIDRLVTWAPHTPQIHGFYGSVPVDALEPLPLFIDEFQAFQGRDDVVAVAPDAGAAEFVLHFSHALGLRSAVASKHRPRPEETVISEVAGDLTNARVAIVLDDMISTGGTLYAVIERLVQGHDIQEVYIGVSHNLCMDKALERLLRLHQDYHLRRVLVTDTVPQTPAFLDLPFLSVCSLAERFARVINQVHYNRPVAELIR